MTTSKILTGVGILLMVASPIGLLVGIYRSFAALHINESAGIGSVGGGIWFALLASVAFFAGLMLLIIGLVMTAKRKSGPK